MNTTALRSLFWGLTLGAFFSVTLPGCAGHEEIESPAVSKVPSVEGADLQRGRMLFLRCRACHTLDPGGSHGIGPNLNGVIGSIAGKRTGYAYSAALENAELTWNEESLGEFLENPNTFLSGTKMVFGGLPDAEDRRAIIAYLGSATDK